MGRFRGGQGGFIGLIVILLALLVVAWLAMTALKDYGLLSSPSRAPAGAAGARGPGAGVTEAPADVTTATPAPLNALDKARGMQDAVNAQAADNARRIDDATK